MVIEKSFQTADSSHTESLSPVVCPTWPEPSSDVWSTTKPLSQRGTAGQNSSWVYI